jgi:hypothetical protein
MPTADELLDVFARDFQDAPLQNWLRNERNNPTFETIITRLVWNAYHSCVNIQFVRLLEYHRIAGLVRAWLFDYPQVDTDHPMMAYRAAAAEANEDVVAHVDGQMERYSAKDQSWLVDKNVQSALRQQLSDLFRHGLPK